MINLINGDARNIALSDGSVQAIITSPPYWALRSYLAADDANKSLELGAERVPDCLGWATGHACGECYVCHIVAVMRECWRVLRSDGTVWLNLGDSFYSATATQGRNENKSSVTTLTKRGATGRSLSLDAQTSTTFMRSGNGLKPKDLCLIPARVALALQAAGWWVRSEIIWHKPNPMPESVTDRPTKAHEMIYLLTKRAEYYYDAIAIQEGAIQSSGGWQTRARNGLSTIGDETLINDDRNDGGACVGPNRASASRNRRSVWTVATSPYSGAHFATFPPALIEPMILAGTSQRGACPTCGKAWKRVVDKVGTTPGQYGKRSKNGQEETNAASLRSNGDARNIDNPIMDTLGFAPACACYGEAAPPLPAEPADISNGDMAAYKAERARLLNDVYPLLPVVPCVVFDPFSGSGTVLRVAIKHGRIGIGNDLNLNYAPLTVDRTSKIQTVMPL